MKRVCLCFVILAVSGITHLRAAEAPRLGEIVGLVGAGQLHARIVRDSPARNLIGNWMEIFVSHGDAVEKGQLLAVYKNSKGRAVLEYIASRPGRVLINSRAALHSVENFLEIITVPHEEYCNRVDCTVSAVD
ncbi:hypothetical protein ACCI51_05510 [Microbulbifer echini]|uniref:Membrane fusion protein biotin-lipoyl like domain-containing protein n=1 Tax=Microbulbifer echini TaxID=1529067 RepID=A0ABV4NKN4_9GAMM